MIPGCPWYPASAGVPPPAALANDPRLPLVFALLARADLPVTAATWGVAVRAASGRLPDAATAVQAWMPEVPLPDVADPGTADAVPAARAAVTAALALAGLRPAPEARTPAEMRPGPVAAEDPAERPPTVLATVADAVAAAPVSDEAAGTLRELAADTLLPPRHLDDYDQVVALPLLAQGQAAPARLAVASRTAGNGIRATWLRVDCELSRLGPVSVRLSGSDGGPVAVTIVASPAGGRVIAAGLPDLMADLESRGLPAAVRVVEDRPW
jgi:hypothetical protein